MTKFERYSRPVHAPLNGAGPGTTAGIRATLTKRAQRDARKQTKPAR